jgi:hypothetical protein
MTATGQVCGDKTKPACLIGFTDYSAPSTANCGTVDATVPTNNNRYPNEPCDDNNGCITKDAKCTDKKCPASLITNCASSADCDLGKACWITGQTGVCKDQLPLGDATCLLSEQCKNSQGCLTDPTKPGTAGKCTDYYSIKLGQNSSDGKLCVSGQVNGKNQCDHIKFAYDGQTADGTSNLVACTPGGDPCKYVMNDKTTKNTITCMCTLSKDGFAWCPAKYEEAGAGWVALAAAKKAKYSYDCHTLRRGTCSEMFSDTNKSDEKKALVQTESANVYYNAEGCILSIFGDSSRIRMGVFGVISMIFAWFML